jgi:hypothetical protein
VRCEPRLSLTSRHLAAIMLPSGLWQRQHHRRTHQIQKNREISLASEH